MIFTNLIFFNVFRKYIINNKRKTYTKKYWKLSKLIIINPIKKKEKYIIAKWIFKVVKILKYSSTFISNLFFKNKSFLPAPI